jgi:23S rRNA (guanine1835-N2)-methyltransferase
MTRQFELQRYPRRAKETLQAWDAADTLLLRQLDEGSEYKPDRAQPSREGRDTTSGAVLIVNDAWGALTTGLEHLRPWTLSDSYLAHAAIRENFKHNHMDLSTIHPLASFDPLPAPIDVVVIKVPKSLALLEDQLHRIGPSLHEKTTILAGAMTKHIHLSTLGLFEKIFGPTRTSLAEKKARLIFCEPDLNLKRPANPWPRTYTIPSGEVVISHAGVFGGDRLDVGTRLLLEHLPRSSGRQRIVDLGCGNGILGVKAALANPRGEVTFIDESYRAVASAEATFRANLGPERLAHFVVGNGLFDLASGAQPAAGFDLVLNNPPFHENHAISDATAWQMFVESRDALRQGGELWIVGNRHLGYPEKLKRLFGNCDVVAGSTKMVVVRASKA